MSCGILFDGRVKRNGVDRDLRFDRGDETEVSINVNPFHRSKGYGYSLLVQATAGVRGDVWAEIIAENTASRRLFERVGFERQGADEGRLRYLRRG